MERPTLTGSRVKTSDMALTMIEKIAFSEEPLTQVQIAKTMGIVKSAAHKHLFTLEELGWVSRDASSGHYKLGPKAWLVGQNAPHISDLAALAEPTMRAARQETGLAVVLSLMTKRVLNVISAFPGTHAIEIGVRRGSSLALHGSAQGQVALAFGDPSWADEICAGDLAALTSHTLTDPAMLRRRIEETRSNGFAVAPEESLLGVNAAAAPVFDQRGQLVGTIGLVGSIQHLSSPPSESHLATLRLLSRKISQNQNGSGHV